MITPLHGESDLVSQNYEQMRRHSIWHIAFVNAPAFHNFKSSKTSQSL
jgi:hypothetical protein